MSCTKGTGFPGCLLTEMKKNILAETKVVFFQIKIIG